MPKTFFEILDQISIGIFTTLLLAFGIFLVFKKEFRIRKVEFKGLHVRLTGVIFLFTAALYLLHSQRGFFHMFSSLIQASVLMAGLLALWILSKKPTKATPLSAGTYMAQSGSDEPAYRLHLRLNNDGSGILILNAATVLHLNSSAAEFAYHMIKGTSITDAADDISSRYRIHKEIVMRDFSEFRDRIQTLIHTPDLDPVSYLDFERVAPHSQSITAPLRVDCALTYHLPEGTQAEYAPVKRVDRELSTAEWKTILDKAWAAGIPHVTFTGGEPTLRNDLPELITHAEKNGQVCGLFTSGRKLADKTYLRQLLDSGLDHLLFLLQPESNESWNAIESIMEEDLFTTVHFTLTKGNIEHAERIVERLEKIGVKSLSLGIAEASIQERALFIRNIAANRGITLRWDLPVPYSQDNPISIEGLEEDVPDGAGKAWIYIEPDGDVLPSQGQADMIMGNILRDPWEVIYPR